MSNDGETTSQDREPVNQQEPRRCSRVVSKQRYDLLSPAWQGRVPTTEAEERKAKTVAQQLDARSAFTVRFTNHPYLGGVDEERLQKYIDEPEDGVEVEQYVDGRLVWRYSKESKRIDR